MSKKKKNKDRKPKMDFAQKLAAKLRASGIGTVEEGSLSDSSGRWVSLRVGDQDLSFSFDMKGENMSRVGVYKDVVEVTGQKRVF